MESLADFTPILLKQLLPDEEIPFSVFLYLKTNKKLINVKKKGDIFPQDRLDDYKKKNIDYVYIRKSEKEAFYQYKSRTFSNILNDEKLTKEEKANQIRIKSRETMLEISKVSTKEESEQIMENCSGITKSIITEVASESFANAFNNITKMVKTGSSLMVHSANVSGLAVMFAMLLSVTDPKQLEEAAMGALVHDLGLSTINEEAVRRYLSAEEIGGEDYEDFKKHPLKALEMLKKMKSQVAKGVLDIVVQHHEHQDGSGFPRHLKAMQISFLAKLVAIADSFDIYYRKLVEEERFSQLKYILVMLRDQQDGEQAKKKYDPKLLNRLTNALLPPGERKLPKDIVFKKS